MLLESLSLKQLVIYLLPGSDCDIGDFRGVLTDQTQLTRLRTHDCITGPAQVAKALSQLPQLLHLDVAAPQAYPLDHFPFPGECQSLAPGVCVWALNKVPAVCG